MILLGLDLETTGTDPESASIIEVGAVLWDSDSGQPVRCWSTLVKSAIPLDPDVVEITGITDDLLQAHGVDLPGVLRSLRADMLTADYIVAHNAGYDRRVLERATADCCFTRQDYNWIDTMMDVPFPRGCQYRNLTYLQAFHGFVNPFPHRALTDVLTTMTILQRYNLADVIERSKSPTLKVKACFEWGCPGFDEIKDFAKSRGFKWNGDKGSKYWWKPIKQTALQEEIDACAPYFELAVVDKQKDLFGNPTHEIYVHPVHYLQEASA
jgi:DNA polymerase-3 subunit epsilon